MCTHHSAVADGCGSRHSCVNVSYGSADTLQAIASQSIAIDTVTQASQQHPCHTATHMHIVAVLLSTLATQAALAQNKLAVAMRVMVDHPLIGTASLF